MPTNLKLAKIRQTFTRPRIDDLDSALDAALATVASRVQRGDRIAVACGSRGIANIAQLVRRLVQTLKSWGADPFIVPAMGSHGGGTADGQLQVLAGYGITENVVGAPICATMDTVMIPSPDLPNPVYLDQYAAQADGIVLINRIKPHTDFHGTHESGLVKMLVIGLGKHTQAKAIHAYGVYGLHDLIPATAARIIATGKIRFGVALVENAYDETMYIQAIPSERIFEQDAYLLQLARANMPYLPASELDVLLVDLLGKDISGAGMDPNIIGRMLIRGQSEPDRPRIKAITVHDLTEASHGNACGIGLADVTTRNLLAKIDFQVTNENIVTSSFLERGKLPLIADTDEQAFSWALRSCGVIQAGQERILRIRDTLHLDVCYVSPPVLDELRSKPDIEVLLEPYPIFMSDGQLCPF